MLHNSQLEAKVAAVNSAHEYANRLFIELTEYFKGFVGKKIFNVGGCLTSKVLSDMPELLTSSYHNKNNYFLSFHIKTTENYKVNGCDGSMAEYYTASIYIGDVSNGVLVNINPIKPEYKTDFTVEALAAKRAEYKRLKDMAENALSELHPFGE